MILGWLFSISNLIACFLCGITAIAYGDQKDDKRRYLSPFSADKGKIGLSKRFDTQVIELPTLIMDFWYKLYVHILMFEWVDFTFGSMLPIPPHGVAAGFELKLGKVGIVILTYLWNMRRKLKDFYNIFWFIRL